MQKKRRSSNPSSRSKIAFGPDLENIVSICSEFWSRLSSRSSSCARPGAWA
jgi:hypothetical protein